MLRAVAVATLTQVVGVFGSAFVFGAALYAIQKLTARLFTSTVGWRGVLWTAWIGTPVHELAHALSCVVFRHRITEMKLYEPDPATGTLGYVRHSYNAKNPYHVIGNFFIGVAPLVLGSVVLYAAVRFVCPDGERVSSAISGTADAFGGPVDVTAQAGAVLSSAWAMLTTVFSPAAFKSAWFWVFLYVSACVASHMAPSPADMEGAWPGFGVLVGVVVAANVLAWLVGVDMTSYVLSVRGQVGFLVALLAYSTVVSAMSFLLSYVVLGVYSRLALGRWPSLL